jgi:hypothetical protein
MTARLYCIWCGLHTGGKQTADRGRLTMHDIIDLPSKLELQAPPNQRRTTKAHTSRRAVNFNRGRHLPSHLAGGNIQSSMPKGVKAGKRSHQCAQMPVHDKLRMRGTGVPFACWPFPTLMNTLKRFPAATYLRGLVEPRHEQNPPGFIWRRPGYGTRNCVEQTLMISTSCKSNIDNHFTRVNSASKMHK